MRFLGFVAVLLMPAVALAGNDDSLLIGDDAAMTGGAITAFARSGAALWYNSGGLANVDHDTVDVSGTVYSLRAYRVPRGLQLVSGASSSLDVNEITVVPVALTYVRPLRRARIGFGVLVADSSDSTLRARLDEPSPFDGLNTEWLLSVLEETQRYHFAIGAAWELNEKWRLGFTTQIIYTSGSAGAQFAGGYASDEGLTTDFISVSADLSATGFGAMVSAGVQYAPNEHWSFGLSLSSPAVLLFQTSTASAVTSFTDLDPDGVSGEPIAFFTTEKATSTSAEFEPFLPARTRLGLAYHNDLLTLSLDADIQHRLDNAVPRRDAVWNLRAGALVSLNETVSLGAGFFTDRNPNESIANAGDDKIDFYGCTLGVSYISTRHLHPELEKKSKLGFGTTVALRYAHGKGKTGGLSSGRRLRQRRRRSRTCGRGRNRHQSPRDLRLHRHEISFLILANFPNLRPNML